MKRYTILFSCAGVNFSYARGEKIETDNAETVALLDSLVRDGLAEEEPLTVKAAVTAKKK
jgi:hypothetical protein